MNKELNKETIEVLETIRKKSCEIIDYSYDKEDAWLYNIASDIVRDIDNLIYKN